jgi:glucokinase
VREASFASARYGGLEQVVGEFLGAADRVDAAAFGIAGPVVDDAVVTTNLPWRVAAQSLRTLLGSEHVRLLNDLEATAYGALALEPTSLLVVNPGRARPGHRAVIAAGTGLGQALLFWDGARHHPVATEGGHADFAPADELEDALLRYLRRSYGRVSYERIVSGPGLLNVFHFLAQELRRPVAPEVAARVAAGDGGAAIGEAALSATCATCVEAVRIVMRVYGAQAGNLALTAMATGGVYVGGGVVPKLLPYVTDGRFLEAFTAKGRYTQFMSEIPLHVILDPKAALLGAATAAGALVG